MHTSTRTYIHTYTCMYADVYIDTHQKNCFNYKTVVADKLSEGGIKGTRGKKKKNQKDPSIWQRRVEAFYISFMCTN